ncbi:MAG: DNA polymerase IV [Bacteroidia bacterium]|nr:DNA polymerase IV [Bacteroidia bacterium]
MEEEQAIQRKIIHIDMDAFYASVEQRDFPEYRGKALAVGGRPEERGVVAAASYEARRFGVRSAMSSHKALQLCPDLIFVRPRFDVYRAVSRHIHSIFRRYTDIIEPLSLDEAYLDVSHDKAGVGSAIKIAREIKQAIREELDLTASAGISVSKFVAKIASDMNKPDGLTFIAPSEVEAFMERLPVEKFHGVGRVTAEKMKRMGWHTGADLKKLSEDELVQHFGKSGHFFYRIVRGIDLRPVQPERETRSVAAEDTFIQDLHTLEEMEAELQKIAGRVSGRLQKYGLRGRTITLKVKFHDFRQITRNQSYTQAVNDHASLFRTAAELLQKIELRPVRLLGISVSNFGEAPQRSPQQKTHVSGQLSLFSDEMYEE